MILFVGGGNSGFEATFRVVSYVSVTSLVDWIPLVGGLLVPYGLYLAVVGIREMHAATAGRDAVIALLVLLAILIAGAVVLGRLT